MLRLINVLERPDSGTVTVAGREMTQLGKRELRAARQNIGMIFQQFNLLQNATVYDNVAFPLRIHGTLNAPRLAARVHECLAIVGLADKAGSYPAQLSGGQKQRAAIARALASRPAVLLCDEPTSALDPDTTRNLLGTLRDINQRLGVTIVIVSHELSVLGSICNRVAVIENGAIAEQFALADTSSARQTALGRELALTDLVTIPTAPIAIYSKKHRALTEVTPGATVALPNDPTNQARALVLLDQLGWIKLRAKFDPVRASEKDIAANPGQIKLVPLEAAQLPRSLADVDFSFVNGNYALASGLKLSDALITETISPNYINRVAVRTADKDKQFAKDIAAAYRSREFLDITNKHFAGYAKPDYQIALQNGAK